MIETSNVYQIIDYPHVLYPLGVKTIQSGFGYSYELDPSIEKIYSYEGSQSVSLPSYSVTFEVPNYSETALKSTNNMNTSGLNAEFLAQYTQLPQSLPERVKELADEITIGKDNWYDQAKAIEQYLKGSSFSYDTQEVMIPGEEDDYVDQFLFESMKGYCDNFSSSMVALLRSLDIPARWVKGYTEGEFRGTASNLRLFEVTNDHAHSWVEVYFPNVGWVSFEPTPGFSNNVNVQNDELTAPQNQESVTQPEPQKQEAVELKEKSEPKGSLSMVGIWNEVKGFVNLHWGWVLAAALMAAGVGYFIFRIRVKWLPFYYIWRFKKLDNDAEHFSKAYLILLKQLDRYGLKREKGQTLRAYALFIDRHFSTTEMNKMTVQYEKYIYGNSVEKGDWKAMGELWEYLIKRTIS